MRNWKNQTGEKKIGTNIDKYVKYRFERQEIIHFTLHMHKAHMNLYTNKHTRNR